MSPPTAVVTTALPFPRRSGKVRDVYDLGSELLIVATDRISAYDVVLPTPIPGKGKILTSLSVFWFKRFADVPNHLLATDPAEFPAALRPHKDLLRGRSMLVRKTKVIPVECVARGFLAGSGWKEYQLTGSVCGVELPPGLRQCERIPTPPGPIFTPATKADEGHDVNIRFEDVVFRVGNDIAELLRARTLDLYRRAAEYAETRGILLADTKFEFGTLPDGSVLLIDEILTPDSSRFWPALNYQPGHDQPSFDKQYLRNWLETTGWDKTPPGPHLPSDVVAGTLARYQEAHERLTGRVCDLS
ncbi:MAG: phosphoribosylaminoimidazolesuccinocarboxamide synthase [Tepidisphaerales bacterium]